MYKNQINTFNNRSTLTSKTVTKFDKNPQRKFYFSLTMKNSIVDDVQLEHSITDHKFNSLFYNLQAYDEISRRLIRALLLLSCL